MKQENIFKFKNLLQGWWLILIFISIAVGPTMAYAADIQMGANGNLIFQPNEVTLSTGESVTFTNGDLPPHNMVFNEDPELSHPDLAFTAGETFTVTFDKPGEYEFQCEPHAGAGMKGVIHGI